MAMDASVRWAQDQWAGGGYPGTAAVGGWLGGIAGEGLFFPGYSYLSELAQRPEYRIISETIATEMTREWIRFQGVGDDENENEDPDEWPGDLRTTSSLAHDFDPAGFDPRGTSSGLVSRMEREDRIGRIEERMTELAVRDHFETMARHDGLFGRAHLFHEIGGVDEGDELKTPLGNGRNDMTMSKVSQKTPLTRLQSIEPVWVYPTTYNATNPLKENWYRPEVWYVMGREIHRSRLTTLIGRPVPDLLKPAYSFGGISLSQLAEPYVNIWLQTRQSVANLIRAFSVMVLMTDLETILQPGSVQGLLERARAFNLLRDNQGLFVANKNSEDFKNVSASLAGLHELQAQAQEHMSFPGRIPLVKLTGIQPSGLNASSEGEIRTFYDTIGSYQESLFRAPLTFTIDLIQLSLFGDVDPGIRFDFVPLWSLTEKEEAEVREVDARTDSALIDAGVISQQESRARVARDPKSPYDSLDPDDVPDLLSEEEAGLEPRGAAAKVALAGEEGAESEGAEPSTSNLNLNENDGDEALDGAHFAESDHPRDEDGRFTSGVSEMNPREIETVNEVVDKKKFNNLVASMRRDGWQGRPILVLSTDDGVKALTGSHRVLAAIKAGIDVPVIEMDQSLQNYYDPDSGMSLLELNDDEDREMFLRKAGYTTYADLMREEIDRNNEAVEP